MPNIAETLTDSARARAMPARVLAAELGEPTSRVVDIARELASRVTGRQIDMNSSMTFDQALAAGGRASAAGALRGPSRPLMRPVFRRVVRIPAHYFKGAGSCHGCGTAGGPSGPSKNYMPPGTPGYYRVPPTVQTYWTIEAGETPSEIAYWVTGSGGVARVRELLDANPEKARTGTPGTPSYNFASFVVGTSVKLPKSWNVYVAKDPKGVSLVWGTRGGVYPEAPAAPAPAPSTPGDFVSTLPAGAITSAKLKLGAWGMSEKIPGWAYPGPYDVNDAVDEAFRAAVRAFQQWSNGRGAKLREDGAFDQPTALALTAYAPSSAPVSSSWPTGVPIVPWPSKELTPSLPGVPPAVVPPAVVPPGVVPPAIKPAPKSDGGAAPLLLAALAAKVFGVI